MLNSQRIVAVNADCAEGIVMHALRICAGVGLLLACATWVMAQTSRDAAASVITTTLSPPANARGWHNSPVTATFTCAEAGISACHGPVLFTEDGARETLTVTTTDDAGRAWSTTVVVNLDATPPSVALNAPSDNLTTSRASVTLTGSVYDATSGVVRVTCNGVPAVVADGIARCTVPLTVGLNAVVLHAMDAAGNSGSAGVRVTREISSSAVTVFPDTVRMAMLDESGLMAATESGGEALGVTWISSNPDVLSISTSGSSSEAFALIIAKAPGDVIVTADLNGQTAVAKVTVVDEAEVGPGTIRWSVAPLAGLIPQSPIEATRVDCEGPDIFAVDADPARRFTVVSGLIGNGYEVWRGTVPGTPLFGDTFGGIVAGLGTVGQPSRAIGRFDRPKGAAPVWRFEAQGEIADVAQMEDGTIYLVEHVEAPTGADSQSSYGDIVAIDGRSGLAKARMSLPSSTVETLGACVPTSLVSYRPSELGPLWPARDGAAYAELLEAHDTWTRVCKDGRRLPGQGSVKASRVLHLVRVTAKGADLVRTLWRWESAGSDTPERLLLIEDAAPGPVIVIDRGDILAFWTHVSLRSNDLNTQLHVTRIADQVVEDFVRVADPQKPSGPLRILVDAFYGPWLYLADGSTVAAIDLDTGDAKWKIETTGIPALALDQRHLILHDPIQGQLIELDDKGVVAGTVPIQLRELLLIFQNSGRLHGVDAVTQSIAEVGIPVERESGWFTVFEMKESYGDVRQRLAGFQLGPR